MADTKDYILKTRTHEGFDKDGKRKTFVEGDAVPLTDAQYQSFKDKFRPIEAKQEQKPAEAPKPAANPNPSTTKTS